MRWKRRQRMGAGGWGAAWVWVSPKAAASQRRQRRADGRRVGAQYSHSRKTVTAAVSVFVWIGLWIYAGW